MRLTQAQINGIISACTQYINQVPCALYLHGSRVDVHAKGGDIDLLLLVNDQKSKEAIVSHKHYILAKIKENIGDQKIDLTIASQAQVNDDPFLQMILPKTVLLKQWP
jgi:hypothetical protein